MRNMIVSVFVGVLIFFLVAVLAATFKEAANPAPDSNEPIQSCPSQKVTPTEGGNEEEVTDNDEDEYGRPRKKRDQRRHLFPRLHRNR